MNSRSSAILNGEGYEISPPPPPWSIRLRAGSSVAADVRALRKSGGRSDEGYQLEGAIRNNTDSTIYFRDLDLLAAYDGGALIVTPLNKTIFGHIELRRGEKTPVTLFSIRARSRAGVHARHLSLKFSAIDPQNRGSNHVTLNVEIMPPNKSNTGKVLICAAVVGGIALLLSAKRKRRENQEK